MSLGCAGAIGWWWWGVFDGVLVDGLCQMT